MERHRREGSLRRVRYHGSEGQEGTSISSTKRYLGAIGCALAAVFVRSTLNSLVGEPLPLSTSLVAVLISVRFFGLWPGMIAAVLGGVGAAVLGENSPARFAGYSIVAVFSIWIVEALCRAHAEARENAELAAERLERLREQTAQREAEERISAQLRAIVESSSDAILSTDLDRVIRSWNRGAENLFGYTAAEAIGKPASILVPSGRTHEQSEILDRIRRGGRVSHFETVRCCKDGRIIDVSLTISPIHDRSGEVIGVSHIARDITEQKALEKQVRETQKRESLGVLAGGVAHDFNNLLTGIMGNTALAMDDRGLSDTGRQRLAEVIAGAERAAALVRQLLAYAGKGRFLVDRLDLSALVDRMAPLLRASFSRLIELDLRLEPKPPLVEADRSQMQQLITNLAINAAEAIGEARGKITIAVSSRGPDGEREVVLEVNDTGCGMDEPTKARIFDPFFSTKFTGRGLGLAAVFGIVRAHNGSISVKSEPGRGSTFTVALPAAAGETQPRPEYREQFQGSGNVLVVDDEEVVRKVAQHTLEQCGYTVELAADGQAGVEAFAARPDDFAAVVLDLTMPVMNGEEALRRIREIRPKVPVVLSSGYSEAEALEHFHNRGLAGFLQKPYTTATLARKVKQALQTGRPARQ